MNKKKQSKILDILFALLGIPGAIIILYGQHVELPQLTYISGGLLLLMTAAWYKQIYFVAMELIQLAGHGANFLNIGLFIQYAVPLLLSIQLLVYYCMTGPMNNIFLFIGVLANCLLALAFTYDNSWIYLFGGAGMAAYAFYCVFKENQAICYIWAILNTVFALTAAFNIVEKLIYG